MFGTFEQPLPASIRAPFVGGWGKYCGLEDELGARQYTGGVHNSPFTQSGQPKAPFMAPGKFNPFMFMRPHRRRFNIISLLLVFLLPTVVFAITTWLFCFSVRDKSVTWAWFFVACCVVLAALFIVKAFLVRRKQREELWKIPWYMRPDDDTWFLVLGGTVILATLLGFVYGNYIYSSFTDSYYTLSQLHSYNATDPSKPGQAYLDAGAIEFTPGSYVDVGMSLGYKDGNIYCVAPIKHGSEHVANIDFWAVGVNCCSGFPGDFNCNRGSGQDAFTRGGLRVTDSSQLAFYKVAVMEATEELKRTSLNPIFITWMGEPMNKLKSMWSDAVSWFWGGVVVYALLQLAIVGFMGYMYWKNRLY